MKFLLVILACLTIGCGGQLHVVYESNLDKWKEACECKIVKVEVIKEESRNIYKITYQYIEKK